MSALAELPVWDEAAGTINLERHDEIVDDVLIDHGIEIDWSRDDIHEFVGKCIGRDESVEQWEILNLLRAVALRAYEAGQEEVTR